MKVCETADFLAAVVPEAATETRTAPAPAIGACMTRAIAATMVLHVAVLFVTTHFFTASAPLALVLHLLTATTPVAVIFSGDRCGTERETSGQRQ